MAGDPHDGGLGPHGTLGCGQRSSRASYGAEIDFIDSLRPGDVAVIAVEADAAVWGELFSAAALGRGARGTVTDGLVRDRARIAALGYPVYGTGSRPADSLGRVSVAEADCPVGCGGVAVAPGDLVVADADGVVFVPRAHAMAAIEAARAKAGTETKARELLAGGARLADVWDRFRVL